VSTTPATKTALGRPLLSKSKLVDDAFWTATHRRVFTLAPTELVFVVTRPALKGLLIVEIKNIFRTGERATKAGNIQSMAVFKNFLGTTILLNVRDPTLFSFRALPASR
jgi:hypothetical protein